MKESKVIILGSLAFDYIMGFKEKFINAVSIDPQKEEYQSTITADSRFLHFGGTAGNIAYNLGLINLIKVLLIGSVGKDFETLGYRNHIQKFDNIDLSVDQHDELFTAACYIVNDIKSNQMIIFHGGALDKCKEINIKEKIKNPSEYLYAINSTQSVEAMSNFADQLDELNIPSIFDPGQITPLFPKELLINIIKKSKILIGNIYEIEQVKQKTNLSENDLMKYLSAIIITKSADGSQLIYKDNKDKLYKIDIPIATPENIIDTTGAGDGYRAGILTGLILNMTLLDSCRLGSIIASFVIETSGAQTQKYDINQIRKRYHEIYGYIPPEIEIK